MEGKEIEEVEQFYYLDSIINSKEGTENDMETWKYTKQHMKRM